MLCIFTFFILVGVFLGGYFHFWKQFQTHNQGLKFRADSCSTFWNPAQEISAFSREYCFLKQRSREKINNNNMKPWKRLMWNILRFDSFLNVKSDICSRNLRYFSCDRPTNFVIFSRDQLTNFTGIFLQQIDEIHNYFPRQVLRFFYHNRLTNFSVFTVINWRFPWFLLVTDCWNKWIFPCIQKILRFFPATDWRISRYFPTADRRNSWFFTQQIGKIHDFFSCNRLANFMVSSSDKLTKLMIFASRLTEKFLKFFLVTD